MAVQTRGTTFGIVEEVTEGVSLEPSATTDYIPLREGFSMIPDTETLETDTIKGDIGRSAPQLGQENPTAVLPIYLKANTTATAPDLNLLYKNAFGTTAIRATEHDVVSSTASTITVDAGEGVEFQRGDALLVKHAASAYEIANVVSVATDTLTLAFDNRNNPGSGTNLGRNTVYRPADTRGSLSLWDYRGNGIGAVGHMSGGKVSELSIEVEAGQLVTGSATVQGLEYFFNPIEIEATDVTIDFNVTGPVLAAATLTAKMYKDPHALATAVTTAMNNAQATDTITCSYSNTTGKFTISSDGSLLELLWNSGAGTANTTGDQLGFTVASDDTGATTYTADNAIHAPGGAATDDLSSPQTGVLDSSNPLVAKSAELFIGDSTTENSCISVQSLSMTLTNELAPVNDICAASGRSAQVTASREFTMEAVLNLQKWEAENYKDFRLNSAVKVQLNIGEKADGVNFDEGKIANVFIQDARISSFAMEDSDGLVVLNLGLSAVSDGSGEVFLNFL